MENQFQNQEPKNQGKFSFFQSNTAKLIMVGILTLVLLIPLNLVQDLISERSTRKIEATQQIASTWGENVLLMGPILKVPYTISVETEVIDEKTKKKTIQVQTYTENAYFFPTELNYKTKVDKVDELKYGIYNAIVFKSKIATSGNFETLDFDKLEIEPKNILWDKATILVKTTNLKSIKSELLVNFNNQQLTLETNNDQDSYFDTLESNVFSITNESAKNFSFSIDYNGSESIEFIPLGKTTTTSIDAIWNSPSFIGYFAPNDTTKKITENDFHADWKIINVNRPFAQQYTEKLPNLQEYAYGVRLIETADQYQQNERASKYGFLVIGLTFLIFFLIQTISKINIHIFQYTMIGLALVMFYTLLISITEHSSFSFAYIIAASAVIIMLLLYSISILKNKKIAFFITAALALLYSFIFVIIQLEDYALLVGSIGLFLILGAVMYFSRKIDWSNN